MEVRLLNFNAPISLALSISLSVSMSFPLFKFLPSLNISLFLFLSFLYMYSPLYFSLSIPHKHCLFYLSLCLFSPLLISLYFSLLLSIYLSIYIYICGYMCVCFFYFSLSPSLSIQQLYLFPFERNLHFSSFFETSLLFWRHNIRHNDI